MSDKITSDDNKDDEVIEVLPEQNDQVDAHEEEEAVLSGDNDDDEEEYELHYLNENSATITKQEQQDVKEEVTNLTVVETSSPSGAQIAVSPLNEFDPGICEGGGGRDTPRPQSAASNRSTWSSGKRRRAPLPPPSPGVGPSRDRDNASTCYSRKSSMGASQVSLIGSQKGQSPSKGDWTQMFKDPERRRKLLPWLAFGIVVFLTLIFVILVFSRFATGFSSGGADYDDYYDNYQEEVGSQEGENKRDWIIKDRYTSKGSSKGVSAPHYHNPSNELSLVLLGGKDEEKSDSAEVLTADGACHLIDGFPAPMPEGRSGHVAAAIANSSILVCGGLTTPKSHGESVISRKCWIYRQNSENSWQQVPGLRSAVRYAAAATVSNQVYVMGGTDKDGARTDVIQVLDSKSFTWSTGSLMPQPVYGHCACAVPMSDMIVVTGGSAERANRAARKHSYQLSTKSGKWDKLPDMKYGRTTHACATSYMYGKPVIVVAGGTGEDQEALKTVEILILRPSGKRGPRWILLGGEMNVGRKSYPALAILRNRVTVAAGMNDAGELLDSVEKFNPKVHKFEFETERKLQWRRADGRAVVVVADWFPNCVH